MVFSATGFTVGFCISYALMFVVPLPVPAYYPLTGAWAIAGASADNVMVMHWYGQTLAALVSGAALGLLLQDKWLSVFVRHWSVSLAWMLMAFTVWQLSSFFGSS